MLDILVAILLFVAIGCAAVFVTGACLFCIGGHFCWEHLQRLRLAALADPTALQQVGPYKQGLQQVATQDDGAPTEEEVEEWLLNLPKNR